MLILSEQQVSVVVLAQVSPLVAVVFFCAWLFPTVEEEA